jgi:hypothetical protein
MMTNDGIFGRKQAAIDLLSRGKLSVVKDARKVMQADVFRASRAGLLVRRACMFCA